MMGLARQLFSTLADSGTSSEWQKKIAPLLHEAKSKLQKGGHEKEHIMERMTLLMIGGGLALT
jgi:hypothetical protein